jgi:hypothetical protein
MNLIRVVIRDRERIRNNCARLQNTQVLDKFGNARVFANTAQSQPFRFGAGQKQRVQFLVPGVRHERVIDLGPPRHALERLAIQAAIVLMQRGPAVHFDDKRGIDAVRVVIAGQDRPFRQTQRFFVFQKNELFETVRAQFIREVRLAGG